MANKLGADYRLIRTPFRTASKQLPSSNSNRDQSRQQNIKYHPQTCSKSSPLISFSKQTKVSLEQGLSSSWMSSADTNTRFLRGRMTVRLQYSLWLKLMTSFFSDLQTVPEKVLRMRATSNQQLPAMMILVLMMWRMSREYFPVGAWQQRSILLKAEFLHPVWLQELSCPLRQVISRWAYSTAAWFRCCWQNSSSPGSCKFSTFTPSLTPTELSFSREKMVFTKRILPACCHCWICVLTGGTSSVFWRRKLRTTAQPIYYNEFQIKREAYATVKVQSSSRGMQVRAQSLQPQVFSRHSFSLNCWKCDLQTVAYRSPGLMRSTQSQRKVPASSGSLELRTRRWRKYLALRERSLQFQLRMTPWSSLKLMFRTCFFIILLQSFTNQNHITNRDRPTPPLRRTPMAGYGLGVTFPRPPWKFGSITLVEQQK